MDSKDQLTEEELKEYKIHHTAALWFGLVCIAIGLPVWWKTTEVYRVSLPHSAIQELSHTKIEYLTHVEVVWAFKDRVNTEMLSNLAVRINRQLDKAEQSSLSSKFSVVVREAERRELASLDKITTESQLHDILATESASRYSVVVTPVSPLLSAPVLAHHNNIFLPYDGSDENALAAQIAQILKDVMRESSVVKSLEAARRMERQKPDKNSMRSFRFHPGYDVTFTLMVPEPDKVQVDWDIEMGIEDYLQPLQASLNEYVNVSVASQVLYFISIGRKPKRGDGFYYFQNQDLPHIINPLESKLGSHASNNPAMNFIIYIPPVNKRPLYIHDGKGERVASNSFISPRWGGVMIYNTESDINTDVNSTQNSPADIKVDMHQVMEVFVSQMRLLLNLNFQMETPDLKILKSGSAELPQWQLSSWLRCRCVENLSAATLTLNSLAQLLGEIGNIVINDDIGKEVESAVASVEASHKFLRMGDVQAAFVASRNAVKASELAFFHPSLLELLYFPEDQKWAIYLPMVLPVVTIMFLPLLSYFLTFIRTKFYLRQKMKYFQTVLQETEVEMKKL